MEILSQTLFQLECRDLSARSAAARLHRPNGRTFANWCFVIKHKEAIKPICFYLSRSGRRRRWPSGRGEQVRCRRDPLCVNSSSDPENSLIYMIVLGKAPHSFLRADGTRRSSRYGLHLYVIYDVDCRPSIRAQIRLFVRSMINVNNNKTNIFTSSWKMAIINIISTFRWKVLCAWSKWETNTNICLSSLLFIPSSVGGRLFLIVRFAIELEEQLVIALALGD